MRGGGQGQPRGARGLLPCMLDELGSFLGILLRQAAQVHGLLHDVEVFIERKGHIGVTVPLKVPGWKPQMVFISMT